MNYHSLAFFYRVFTPAISAIVPETCSSIYASMKDAFLRVYRLSIRFQNILILKKNCICNSFVIFVYTAHML